MKYKVKGQDVITRTARYPFFKIEEILEADTKSEAIAKFKYGHPYVHLWDKITCSKIKESSVLPENWKELNDETIFNYK